jgi:hypothetical protein
MTWQRGRILPCTGQFKKYCELNGEQVLHGRTCWISGKKDSEYFSANGFDIRAEFIELLPDFLDDVPLMSWQEFVESCRNSKASQS